MFPIFIIFDVFDNWALLIARIILGGVLIAHGLPKFKSLKRTAEQFHGMGFRPGSLWGTLAALLEFVGGICIFLGFYTDIPILLLLVEFIVIIVWKTGGRKKFFANLEIDVLIFALLLLLVTVGVGDYSLERYLLGIF